MVVASLDPILKELAIIERLTKIVNPFDQLLTYFRVHKATLEMILQSS